MLAVADMDSPYAVQPKKLGQFQPRRLGPIEYQNVLHDELCWCYRSEYNSPSNGKFATTTDQCPCVGFHAELSRLGA